MKISIILGHPRADSFNHALAAVALATVREAGHEVRFHDLQYLFVQRCHGDLLLFR